VNGNERIDGTLSVWIGKECQRLREQRGLTCVEAAETTGVELAVIEKIERGEMGTLGELTKALEFLGYLYDDPVDREPLGAELTQLREHRGLSQAQLAESSGLDVDTIEQFERDQRSPRLFELRRLARGLGLQLSELFEDPATEP
jgi:transcriptional regulator with XRE-family HTH domain